VEDVTARINHGQHFPFNVPQPCPSYD
jgi:hypothetical protein